MEEHCFKRSTWMGIITLWRVARRVCGSEIITALAAELPSVRRAEAALEALGVQPGEEVTGGIQIRYAKFENAVGDIDAARIHVAYGNDPTERETDKGPSLVWVMYCLQNGQTMVAEWRWVPTFDQFALAEVSLEPLGQRPPFDVRREITYTPTVKRDTLMPIPIN